jgi:GR25 family glycosyltransferase involved in LPS biosynthesis
MNKLDGFGPVYVINLKSRKDRKDYITKELKANKVKYELIEAVDGSTADFESMVINHKEVPITKNEMGATVSHLKAIKHYLDNSDSDYAIIIEDDLSFETVENWDFTFQEFVDSVDKDFDILQMCIIHNYNINKKLHIREAGDWSSACYFITRKWAEQLVAKHIVEDKYRLYRGNKSVADSIIYEKAKVYSIPLFTNNLEFDSNINQQNMTGSHLRSYNQIIKYWEVYSATKNNS